MIKQDLLEWTQIVFNIASTIGVGLLVWYAVETCRLRRLSFRQHKANMRPCLIYLEDHDNITVSNTTKSTALNVVLMIKNHSGVRVLDEERHLAALGPEAKYTTPRNGLSQITYTELSRRMPQHVKFIEYLKNKETNCLAVIYQDLNGSDLYTIHHGSGDQFGLAGETGYVNELKRIRYFKTRV